MQHPSTLDHAQAMLADAMRERRMIMAVYNGSTLKLAPHTIVLRNDAFYVGALNPAKNRCVHEDPALGYFKVDGLSQVSLLDERFDPLPEDARVPVREGDRVIAALD